MAVFRRYTWRILQSLRETQNQMSNQIIAFHAAGILSAVRSTTRLGKVLKRNRKHLFLHFAMSEATSSNRATEEASLPMLYRQTYELSKGYLRPFSPVSSGCYGAGGHFLIFSFSHFFGWPDLTTPQYTELLALNERYQAVFHISSTWWTGP